MNGPPFTALGIDVGGTKIAAGIVDFPSGRVSAQRTISTAPHRGGEAVLNELVELAGTLCQEVPVQGVGIGVCELVDPFGRILSANCLRWEGEQVRKALSHFGPVFLEADVRAAAQAEAVFGAGQPYGIFLYVTVGTGISSCLMLHGTAYPGAVGATGTMGSSALSLPCNKCGAQNELTLEQIASGPALVARYNELRPGSASTGNDVLAAAVNGDPDALAVARSAGHALGSVVGLLINVLDPEAVIVGGGLGLSEGPYWQSFESSTREHIWSDVHRRIPVVQAKTGQNAGVIGAAAIAWKHAQREPFTSGAA